jgi:hypothetical protein
MRTILIIQSLIILAGAYYIYTLAHSTPTPVDEPAAELLPQTDVSPASVDREDETKETTDDETAPAIGTTITGPNDAGMEFPIPDDEMMLEVR